MQSHLDTSSAPQPKRPANGDFVRVTAVHPSDESPELQVGECVLAQHVTPCDDDRKFSLDGNWFLIRVGQGSETRSSFVQAEVLSSWVEDFWLDAISERSVASVLFDGVREPITVSSTMLRELVRGYRTYRDLVCAGRQFSEQRSSAPTMPPGAADAEAAAFEQAVERLGEFDATMRVVERARGQGPTTFARQVAEIESERAQAAVNNLLAQGDVVGAAKMVSDLERLQAEPLGPDSFDGSDEESHFVSQAIDDFRNAPPVAHIVLDAEDSDEFND